MTKYTPNYDLDQYEGTDVPNLADQYNNAMGKIDTALHLQAGDVGELAGKLATLNQTITTINTEIEGANSEIKELTAELAALGITDEGGATALLATITGHGSAITSLTTVQEQHTQEISDVMADVSKVEADYLEGTFSTGRNISDASPFNYADLLFRQNLNKSAFKLWGVVAYNNTSSSVYSLNKTAIPGKPGRYGVPIALQLSNVYANRIFSYVGLYQLYRPNRTDTYMVTGPTNFETDANGNVYLFTDTSDTYNVPAGMTLRVMFWQTIYSSAIAPVSNPPEE